MAVKPTNGAMHHYSQVPEIFDMILSSFPAPHSDELKQRYLDRTKPCIVKFISVENERQIIGCAADYVLHLQKGYALECFLPRNFDGAARQIPSQRIVYSKHINIDFAHR